MPMIIVSRGVKSVIRPVALASTAFVISLVQLINIVMKSREASPPLYEPAPARF